MCNSDDGGRWMICHFGHGGPFNNNGTESINAGIRLDVVEISAADQKSPMHSRDLLARTSGNIRRKSEEQRLCLQKSHGCSSSLQNIPGIELLQAKKLQKLHPLVLSLITPVGYEEHWRTQIAKLMKNDTS